MSQQGTPMPLFLLNQLINIHEFHMNFNLQKALQVPESFHFVQPVMQLEQHGWYGN
jgi:hypothetical protein